MRTKNPQQNETFPIPDTVSTQETLESERQKVKFPKKLKHRGRVFATIYGKSKSYSLYRVAWTTGGRRLMKAHPSYSDALKHADGLVSELAKGSQVPALTAGQARDALAAFERLEELYRATGKRLSLLAAVSELAEGYAKLNGHSVREAVEGFARNIVSVKRKVISEAAEEFISAEEPRTKASNGQRSQLSPKYAYNRAIILRRFAACFPNTSIDDLTKKHLDTFFQSKPLVEFSAKSRNHHRATVRQFLGWSVRKDFLAASNRLEEADGLRPEKANTAEILFYSPTEFRALLESSEGSMRAMIALGGLAGLRTTELLRLTWQDVWRVPSHIEITAGKSKTRQRRLVEICPALAAWLEPFRSFTDGKLCPLHEVTWQQHFVRLCEKAEVTRKPNGLRHAFCTFHFAAHSNENLTAAQAGNTPAMIHRHYKGLATKNEAEQLFNVAPTKAENVICLQRAASQK
jgi:integrase